MRGEWWTGPTTLRTDAARRVEVSGFRGDYLVSSGAVSAPFALDDAGAAEVTLAPTR